MNKALFVMITAGALTMVGASPAIATEVQGHTPVTICHATSSETNPYVTITVDDDSVKLQGHLAHEDDIIPAPAAGCPGPAVVVPPVEPPVVVPPVVVPPVEPPVVTDPPPVLECAEGEEVSGDFCAPADLPCPGQDSCPPLIVPPVEPPVVAVPPVAPPVAVTPPVQAALSVVPPAPLARTGAAEELANTGFNGWPLAAGAALLLLGGGLLLRPRAR